MTKLKSRINSTLKLLIFTFPILIIIGPFAVNSFAVIFSLYGLANYKTFIKNNIFNKEILIFFFSFLVLIFPYESINFQNSILKYLAFSRFILMLFGLIVFFKKENFNNNIFNRLYKIYVIYFIIISMDVIVELIYGSNLFGYSSGYEGRIASFTNDELIIGYIFSFLFIFSSALIYKKIKYKFFLIILSIVVMISFIIGERSNFIKLLMLLNIFYFLNLFYFDKIKLKNILIIILTFFILLSSFYILTKDTFRGYKFYSKIFDISFSDYDNKVLGISESKEEKKLSKKIKEKFYSLRHAPHYYGAYRIFLNYPLFGIGINNFYIESGKEEYKNNQLEYANSGRANHPHQIYLEILSEVGLFGSIYFFFIIFYPIYISVKYLIKNRNTFVLSHLLLHIFFIMPILPSGSFFGTNYGVPFWFNLSILLYLSIKKIKI